MSLEQLNTIVLTLTFFVLIWYAFDTHRIASQTVEVNLMPVILRGGWITDWKVPSVEDINSTGKPNFIEFINHKNIVKDMTGFIVIDGKKYILLFGSDVSKEKNTAENTTVSKINMAPKWGWLPPGGKVYATFEKQKFEKTTRANQIYLEYRDIEGNSYYTKEDEKFSQTSGRI